MTTPAPHPAHRRARALFVSIALLGGCSDFLGIDEFGDQSQSAGGREPDADDPSAAGAGGAATSPLEGHLLWWSAFGAGADDVATSLTLLSDAVQVGGLIEGAVDFGGGAIGAAGRQGFVARLDLEGKHLWSAATAGSGRVDQLVAAASSDAGAVVAGSYRDAALTLGGQNLPSPATGQALFVAWLDGDGQPLRAETFALEGEITLRSIDVSSTGDVAVAGRLRGSLDLGNDELVGSATDDDALLLVTSDEGVPMLATNFRSTGDDRDQHLSVARYDDGDALWIGGSFGGSIRIGSDSLSSIGISDGLLARIGSDGALQDFLQLGGGQGAVDVTALHPDDPFTVSGRYRDRVLVGSEELESVGDEDIVVAALDDGLEPLWAKTFGSSGSETVVALDVDGEGHVTLAGSFSGSFAPDLENRTSAGESDGLVIKLDATGELLWLRTFGRQRDDRAAGLAVDEEGHVFVAGTFGDGIELDDELLKANGGQDVLVLELDR